MADFEQARAQHLIALRRALARYPRDVVAGFDSAALVHRLPTFTPAPTVTLVRATGSVRSGRTRVRVAELCPQDVCVGSEVRATTLARTAIDVARERPFGEGLAAIDAALRRGVRPEQLQELLRRMYMWPGGRSAALAVAYGNGLSESAMESLVRARFVALRLPVPALQVWVPNVRPAARADFWWGDRGLVGEADGRVKYADPDALWQEKLRQERLEEAGCSVIRWTWAQAMAPDAEFSRRFLRAWARAGRRFGV